MTSRLSGQVVLVTGGGRGIGRHLSIGLAEHGASVGVLARTRSELDDVVDSITTAGGRAIALPVDVTQRSDVEHAIDELEAQLGPLTLLINNAGTCHAVGPLWEVDPDEWWREVEIHVRGAMLASHIAMGRMIPRGSGRIINVYGNLGDAAAGAAYCSAYAVAKASLLRLTEHCANEAAGSGVGVLALHPGFIRTPMIDELATGEAGRRWLPRFHNRPAEDFDDPAEVVDAVVALASGVADGLSGRLVLAWEDIEAAAADADAIRSGDIRTLRLTGP